MRDGGRSTESEQVGARAIREWITGQREEYSRVFLVESGAPTEGIREVAGRDDVVLLPETSGRYEGPARAVRYRGALDEIGDELFLGETSVEVQDYVAAVFVQIVGPTAVCLLDAAGWYAFLTDAEIARDTGVFPSALIDPRVLLADRAALMNPRERLTPSAIRVRSDGRVSVGMRGEVIGTFEELPTVLAAPLPGVAAWGDMATREELAADLETRESIGRYLFATDLMKMLRLSAVKISGFGWSPVDDRLADAAPLTTDPFLLETADGFLLADTGTPRRRLLSPITATVVAVVQTSSTLEVAAARVARQLSVSPSDARGLCREAAATLNIHCGTRRRPHTTTAT
ncbi:daptide biosynthesis RiPP recognition protein [Microbacterium sp. EST19A]|uniref:daptide biosynthesis RiPP recognition protein n=1 Tax=Microbacterium sp. EST19A TaxID=2862681 RepID=UPI0021D7FB73|nr:daptide biosynthesis RiPP recognition protein [Microbacterium sp. EST19A]